MEEADRYTVLTTTFDNLAGYLKACSQLRLAFFVENEPTHSDTCLIYIFLDGAGMRNYLNGCYDEGADGPRECTNCAHYNDGECVPEHPVCPEWIGSEKGK